MCRKKSQVFPNRGPSRARGSKIKIKCAFQKCRSGQDCKNKPFQLTRVEVNQKARRTVRNHSKYYKFCCQNHLRASKKVAKATRGGREALGIDQVCLFFETLVWECHAPWAGVLMLLQLSLGDRCDCARQATTEWFSHLSKDAKGLPEVRIPHDVNGKTRPRIVPLHPAFAEKIWGWLCKEPFKSGKTQWPVEGQALGDAIHEKKSRYLFCGKSGKGLNTPILDKPITERAFLKQIERATQVFASPAACSA